MIDEIVEKIYWDEANSFLDDFIGDVEKAVKSFDEKNVYSDDLLSSLKKKKALVLTIEEDKGGLGLNIPTVLYILRRISSISPTVSLSLSTHIQVLDYLKKVNVELYNEIANDVAENGSILSIAITEPGAGTDIKKIETIIEQSGENVSIKGIKSVVTNGIYAKYFFILGKGLDGAFATVLLPRDERVETLEIVDIAGTRGAGIIKAKFNNTVNKKYFLETGKPVFRSLFRMLSLGRLFTASSGLGVADALVSETFKWASQREILGKKLIDFDNVKQAIGEIVSLAEVLWTHILTTGINFDRGKDISYDATLTKFLSTDLARKMANIAASLHGSHGYKRGTVIERFYRDVKSMEFIEGSNDALRAYIHGVVKRRFGEKNLIRLEPDDFR